MKVLLSAIVAAALLLGGCGARTPTPAPTPTATSTTTPTPGRSPTAAYAPSTTADTTPPRISLVRVEDISLSHMDIGWYTDEPATSQVEYGTKPEYGSFSALYEDLTMYHGVTLGSLLPLETYHFRVRSKDAAGNEAISGDVIQVTLPYTN